MGQWSELPSDLLNAIDAQLVYVDKVRARAVCESWYSLLPNMPNYKLQQLPWLLQAFVNNKETSHGLFNLREEKFYQLDLPEAHGWLFKGSCHGWVVMMGGGDDIYASNPDIYLFNPLTRVQIQLPPRYTFPDVEGYCADRVNEEYHLFTGGALDFFDSNHVHRLFLDKVVTSSIPSSEDCVVVAIYGEVGKVAWCTRNHKKWTPLNLDVIGGSCEDIIFSKNKVYIVSCHGRLLEVENIGRNPKVTIIAPPPANQTFLAMHVPDQMYLVECSDGSLIMVGRYIEDMITVGFKVYKLDAMNSTWLVVDNIGDDMLFFGINYSLSISSCDLPGYKGNRIYFTDCFMVFAYVHYRDSDIGVFNLEDGSIERLSGVPKLFWPPPVWVMPPKYH